MGGNSLRSGRPRLASDILKVIREVQVRNGRLRGHPMSRAVTFP